MPENVKHACEEIKMHPAMHTGNYIQPNQENDFHYKGTDVNSERRKLGSAWLTSNPLYPPNHTKDILSFSILDSQSATNV